MAVGSVVNALAILRHLAEGERQGVNAIARALSLSPSTCFNILKTLTEEGFLDFEQSSKSYSIGSEPGRLFGGESNLGNWTTWVGDALKTMAADFAITCGLWRRNSGRVVLVDVAESARTTRIHLTRGQRLPAYIGAMGRCIAAAERLDLKVVEEKIAALRWQDPPTAEAYFDQMQDAARRGWAIDDGNYLKGVTTIASGIASAPGAIRYCITSIMFNGQHDAASLSQIGDHTAALAREATERLAGAVSASGKGAS